MTTAATADPGLVETVQSAFSGDVTMARELAGVLGLYSIRIPVASLTIFSGSRGWFRSRRRSSFRAAWVSRRR